MAVNYVKTGTRWRERCPGLDEFEPYCNLARIRGECLRARASILTGTQRLAMRQLVRRCSWVMGFTLLGSTALAQAAAPAEPEPVGQPPGPAAAPKKTDTPPAAANKTDGKPAQKPEARDAPLPNDEKRKLPDYDGRGEEATTAGDVLIWVPRILLSPLYLVSEFVVRRPLGWVVTTAEREEIPTLLIDFFTFGPERNAGIVPTALFDFGVRSSIGLYGYFNEFLADNNDLRLRAAWGGPDWLLLNAANILALSAEEEVTLRAQYLHRPDHVFHGFGPTTQDDGFGSGPRYLTKSIETGLIYEARFWRSSILTTRITYRDVALDPTIGCCDDPTVAEEIAVGRYPEPPGVSQGFKVLTQGIDFALDTRHRREPDEPMPRSGDFVAPSGTGVRFDLRGEHVAGPELARMFSTGPIERWQWVRYGASLGGYVDFTGEERTLSLTLVAGFADPVRSDGNIPFSEQITLGGEGPMRGFLRGRLVDRSGIVARLEYQWPVWVWLDGIMHYAVGNVFGPHLDGFEPNLLRSSFGIGMRANSARDHPFEILLAFGTRTFEAGSGIENMRFVIGATSGF